MKVCIDLRRDLHSGIGKVSLNITKALLSDNSPADSVQLVVSSKSNIEALPFQIKQADLIIVDCDFFSREDLYTIPKIIERSSVDMYIAPQYYMSPFVGCRSIRMIHDIWPLLYPGWLPSKSEALVQFGQSARDGVTGFVKWFDKNRKKLPCWESAVFRNLYQARKNNPVSAFALAMFAASIDSAVIVPTCSRFSEAQIQSVFPYAGPKLRLLYPFVNKQEISSSEKTTNRGFRVLHVGKFEPRKNHDLVCKSFIKAYDKLTPIEKSKAELILIGDPGYRAFGRELLNKIRKWALKYPVKLFSNIDDGLLAKFYKEADIFPFPSVIEGFGIPMIEAMSFGLPIITAGWGAMAEVANGAAFLINDLDAEILSDALLEVYRNEALYKHLVTQSLERAEDFTFKQMQNQVVNIVRDAVTHPSPKANTIFYAGAG